MRAHQAGTTTVEFAIVAVALFTVMFGVIEFGRTLFTLSVLNESTRRGARVAAVCAIGDPAIVAATRFVSLPGLTIGNVQVDYLNQNGGVVGNPGGNFELIRYVRVRIVGYQYQAWIPFMSLTFASPEFSSIVPRESLGVPRVGPQVPCEQ